MASVLLGAGSEAVATVVLRHLSAGGHTAVQVNRALAVLTEAKRTVWDLVLVDDTPLGHDLLVVLAGIEAAHKPIIGIGFEDLRLANSLALPLDVTP